MTPYLVKTRPRCQVVRYLLLFLAIAGCARTVAQSRPARLDSPSFQPISLRVALYMDGDFRQYTHRERNFHVPLGELFSQKLPADLGTLFSEIDVVTDPARLDSGVGKYQAVLRPRIRFVSYHPFFRQRRTLLEPQGRVRIYSAWTLSDPWGRTVWFQEIVGQAEGDARSRSRLEAAIEAAMADLLKKLQSALVTSPRIHNYAYGTRQR